MPRTNTRSTRGASTRRTTTRRTATPRTARATRSSSRGTVLVGRFGSEPIAVAITGRSTVLDVLQKAGVELQSSEHVWLNGSRTELMASVKGNDTINIVSPKQAGLK